MATHDLALVRRAGFEKRRAEAASSLGAADDGGLRGRLQAGSARIGGVSSSSPRCQTCTGRVLPRTSRSTVRATGRGLGDDRHAPRYIETSPRRGYRFIAPVHRSRPFPQPTVAVLPLVNQMSPSADVLALASTEIDISKIAPGQAIKTIWRKQPVFVRNLTPAEIQQANKVPLGELRDPQTLAERTKPGKSNWLITLGVCTHLGCVPLGTGEGENRGEYGGYFCPCHGSHYDTAARIRKGPAPTNLEVPEYAFTSDTVIKVG